jgi:integrase
VALIDAAYAPSTTTKYSSHANRFYDWLLQHGHRPSSFISLDKLLVIYLQELYDTGMGKAAANATVFGLNVAQPGVTDHLPAAKKALKGFNKLVPSRQHPPLTWPITCIIALEMIRRGHFNEGVVTLLAFDCYLRINEALGLYREDVALGADVRIGMGRPDRLYLRLQHTKTGDEQGVEVLNEDVKALIIMCRDRVKPRTKLFAFTSDYYRRLFHRVCDDLKLPSGYVPHSLRHGGATYGYLNDMPFTDIAVRGRWKSINSATHYVQQFRQALLTRVIPDSVAMAAKVVTSQSLIVSIREVLAAREASSRVPSVVRL